MDQLHGNELVGTSSVKITWYGTASILIETENTSLLFDPFMKDLPSGIESQEITDGRRTVFQKQENVLITHGHFDHLSSVCDLFADRPCTVYASASPCRNLQSQGFPQENLRVIGHGDCLRFADVTVRVYQGKHVRFDLGTIRQRFARIRTKEQRQRLLRMGRLNAHYPERNETLFFEIIAEGKRIQLMGSAELAKNVDYPTSADVLILPHQGRSDMDQHNRIVAQTLQPKRILMDHYDDAFPPISMAEPVDPFCEKMSIDIPTEKLLEGVPVLV